MPSSASVANDAALIVTFYYLRDPSGQRDFTEPLMTHLKQELALNQPDGHPKVWLEGFNPVEKSAHDISVVQLTLNATDQLESADTAWVKLSDRLGQLLSDEGLFFGMVGYTLVYQAVLKQRFAPLFATLFASLLPNKANRRKLLLGKPSAQILKPLAATDTEYGRLWLLDIPLQQDGRQASAVYVALCREDANDDFVGRLLWGKSATWLLPDLRTKVTIKSANIGALLRRRSHLVRNCNKYGTPRSTCSLTEASNKALTSSASSPNAPNPSSATWLNWVPCASRSPNSNTTTLNG